ncbi:MAG: HEPN domain-containing protein [Christensenellales bacterium]
MPDTVNRDLSQYRLSQAKDMVRAAGVLHAAGEYKSGNNRAYYAMFHAARALLALERVDYKKHSAVISHFQREYVHTGRFSREYSDMLMNASAIRNSSDYDDFYLASRDETAEQIENARRFVDAVEAYILKHTE